MLDRHWVRNGLLATIAILAAVAVSAKEDTTLCRQGWSSYSVGKYEEAIGLYARCMQADKVDRSKPD